MKCPLCPQWADYEYLYRCEDCKQLYCENHISPLQHNCPSTRSQVLPIFVNLFPSRPYHLEAKPLTKEEKNKIYEQILSQSEGVIMVGNELVDLVLGTLLIFLVFSSFSLEDGSLTSPGTFLPIALRNFLIIAPAFLLHELAHKYEAIKRGFYARFVLHKNGIFFTLLTLILRFGIVAPGFVAIIGRLNKKDNGIVSLVGPAVNLVLAFVSLSFFLLFPSLSEWFLLSGFVNAFLSLFNLLPVWNLDGKKIFVWNKFIWTTMVVLSLFFFYYSMIHYY